MRPNRQYGNPKVPEVNLVPMMDVLMTVLTFFIIISMTLSSQQILTVEAPQADEAGTIDDENPVQPFVVGLNEDGEILIEDRPIDEQELVNAVSEYLNEHPDGYLRLKASRELEYQDASALLQTLQRIAVGREVTLVVD